MFAYRFVLMLLAGTLAVPTAEYPGSYQTLSYVPAIQVILTGRITEEGSGSPVQGAQVSIEGGTSGTVTNRIGEYVLSLGDALQGKKVTLVVQALGYATVRKEITLAAGSNTLDLSLTPTLVGLEELVVSASRGSRNEKISQMYPAVAADFAGRGSFRRMPPPGSSTPSPMHTSRTTSSCRRPRTHCPPSP